MKNKICFFFVIIMPLILFPQCSKNGKNIEFIPRDSLTIKNYSITKKKEIKSNLSKVNLWAIVSLNSAPLLEQKIINKEEFSIFVEFFNNTDNDKLKAYYSVSLKEFHSNEIERSIDLQEISNDVPFICENSLYLPVYSEIKPIQIKKKGMVFLTLKFKKTDFGISMPISY